MLLRESSRGNPFVCASKLEATSRHGDDIDVLLVCAHVHVCIMMHDGRPAVKGG